MIRYSIISVFLTLFLVSCAEEEVANREVISIADAADTTLVGSWVLVEQKVSIGSPATWEPVTGGDTIRFYSDGSFTWTHLDCVPVSYAAEGDLIKLTYDCPEDSDYADWPSHVDQLDYRIVDFTGQSLTVTPATFVCFESCLYRYQRIRKE